MRCGSLAGKIAQVLPRVCFDVPGAAGRSDAATDGDGLGKARGTRHTAPERPTLSIPSIGAVTEP